MRSVARAAILAGLALAALEANAVPGVGGCQVFPSNNYWNTPIDTLPVHASSAAWVSTIGDATKLHPDWGNVLADNYGIPFITVTGAQPLVPIVPYADPNIDYSDESDPGPYPIPPNAPIEGGSGSTGDRHVIVIETTNCVLYELFYATPNNGGATWSASSFVKFPLNSNALRTAGWTSADAAGLPIFPGLVRWEEVAAGEIAHAIRFTAANIWGRDAATGQPKYLWPARHWSGSSTVSTRPPMGARFRLKAGFDISSFSAPTQVILRAFKKYGLVLADAGSNWYFQGVSDTNWPDAVFNELKTIAGSNFEAVDASVLQVDPNSAQAALPVNPARLYNISTRMRVLTNDDVMIAGFIVGGPVAKKLVINVAGPSLSNFGIASPLANPTLTLVRSSDNAVIGTNDNWQTQTNPADVSAIQASGFQPNNTLEPALIATLAPGAYTAIVQGANGGTGVGLVGLFEVDHPEVPLINISTRGKVLVNDDVMIAGFIIQGDSAKTVVVNVAGPSLTNFGIASPLQNPQLTLVRSSDNAVIATNDDWQTQADPADVTAITNSGFKPNHALEPAIIATLAPGAYTAIVSGVGGGTGVGLVGVFATQ
jgi:hypothetical protein